MQSIIKHPELTKEGASRIQWFREKMPIIRSINETFVQKQTFKGKTIAICLHIEPKTAYWIEGLLGGGAEHIYLVGCLGTTMDDTAAYLASLPNMTVLGSSDDSYDDHLRYLDMVMTMGVPIDLFLDNGASLILAHHRCNPGWQPEGGNEETRTGRLLVDKEGYKPPYPVYVIDDSMLKRLLENATGVGQSVVDGFMRATSLLVGGKRVLVIGYGYCGKGVATKFKGLGANTMVYDIDPLYRLAAKVDGHVVGALEELIPQADVIVTVTGRFDIITSAHISYFKDGVILANSGHFGFEIDVPGLKAATKSVESLKKGIERLVFEDRTTFLLESAHPLNLSAADGNPIEIMDLGLGLQAACAQRLVEDAASVPLGLQNVPDDISRMICEMALEV